MRSGSAAWGVCFVALGLGAALLVGFAGLRSEQRYAFGRAERAYKSRLDADVLTPAFSSPMDVRIEGGEVETLAEAPLVTIGKPPRIERVRYHYGSGYRLRGSLPGADRWFPFVAAALVACGVIGFIRIRIDRARA